MLWSHLYWTKSKQNNNNSIGTTYAIYYSYLSENRWETKISKINFWNEFIRIWTSIWYCVGRENIFFFVFSILNFDESIDRCTIQFNYIKKKKNYHYRWTLRIETITVGIRKKGNNWMRETIDPFFNIQHNNACSICGSPFRTISRLLIE